MLHPSWRDGTTSEMRVQFRRRSRDASNEMHKLFKYYNSFLPKALNVFLEINEFV